MKTIMMMLLVVGLYACSDNSETSTGNEVEEHVWSDQVNTIDKASGVEDILGEAGNRQRDDIEQQSR